MNGRGSDEYSDREILDAAPVGVTIIDSTQADAPSVYVNERFLELTGYSRAAVLDSGYRLLVGPETRQEQVERIERAIADGNPAVVELRNYRKDGTVLWSRVRLAPLADDAEETLLFHEDISERREREQELQDRNERLEEFADVVSHDLRNPLSVLDGSLELARQTGEEEYFDRAERAVERMTELIDGLLELARRGDGIGELEPVDLVAVAEACWATVVTETATLSVRTDQTIRANDERVRQLLENLFRNAVEHGDAWEITLGELSEGTGFYVEDDGAGIPSDRQPTVFESGYTTSEDGTGFGLAICKQIADAHGWEITVRDGQNGGTRFEITGVEIVSRGGRR